MLKVKESCSQEFHSLGKEVYNCKGDVLNVVIKMCTKGTKKNGSQILKAIFSWIGIRCIDICATAGQQNQSLMSLMI